MSPSRLALALVALSALGAWGCIEDLDPKSIVKGPRIVDVIADRPEARFGERINFHVLLAGVRPEELSSATYSWSVCLSPDSSAIPQGSFGQSSSEEGCFGSAAACAVSLGNEPTALLPVPPPMPPSGSGCAGGRTDAGLPLGDAGTSGGTCAGFDLGALQGVLGSRLTCDAILRILREIGIVVKVGVEVRVAGQTLRGLKRVVVSTSVSPNQNPPPPRFSFGTTRVTTSDTDPESCRAEDGSRLTLRPGQEIELAPDPDESWLEPYTALTATGEFQARTENAFYSWYATAGGFARNLTRAPTRNNLWTAPSQPGPVSLWLLLRDGRGGSSGCRYEVSVE